MEREEFHRPEVSETDSKSSFAPNGEINAERDRQLELERKLQFPKVSFEAPVWKETPPRNGGYGGIEDIIGSLIDEFESRNLPLTRLNANRGSTATAERLGSFHPGVDRFLHDPEVRPLVETQHSLMSYMKMVNEWKESPENMPDIIHEHTRYIGPGLATLLVHTLRAYGHETPPVLVTVHQNFTPESDSPQDQRLYSLIERVDGVYINSISDSQVNIGFPELAFSPSYVGTVYNGIPVEKYTFRDKSDKMDFLLSLSRITSDKGQALAIRIAKSVGLPLVIAGGIEGSEAGRRYFEEKIRPELTEAEEEKFLFEKDDDALIKRRKINSIFEVIRNKKDSVIYVGEADFEQKNILFSRARAFLFPIQWEEPFGLVQVESMACGTPVFALRKGSTSEVIKEGVSGHVAKGVNGVNDLILSLKNYLHNPDIFDPSTIKEDAKERFNVSTMADRYLQVYREIFKREAAKKTISK